MRSKRQWWVSAAALVALCFGSSTVRAQDDGLLIYLPLDDGQGLTATASSKGEETIDGVLENDPLWVEVPDNVPGCFGLEFDGATNWVRIEPEDPFDEPFSPQSPLNEGQITICSWVKVLQTATDNHGQGRQPIVMKGAGGEWEYALYVYDDFGAGMSVWNCGGSGVSEPSAPGTLIQDEWHHVCGSFDIVEGVRVYVDAIEVASSAPNGNEPCDGTRPVFIGHREDGQFLNAEISEVAIWNRVLELEEIEENMDGALATKKEDCVEVTCPEAGDPDFADTHCAGIEVTGPEGNVVGGYTATVDAADDTDDAIRYTLEVHEKDAPDNTVTVTKSGEGEFTFRLEEGTWTIIATVDDTECPDEAADATCTIDIVVGAREDSGLILYLPLDDEEDVTENVVGEDGVLVGGPEWVDGVMGEAALEFDGLTQYVEIQEDLSPQAPGNEGELSICAWVRVLNVATDGHGQTRQPIVMKGAGGEWEYALYVYDDFGAGMSVWNCGGTGVSEPGAPGTLIPEEWHHVCGTFSVVDGVVVYVDGQEVARLAPNANEPCDGTQPVLIASRADGQFLNAGVDEVGMWNRVLTPDEVIEVMEEGVLFEEEPPDDTQNFTRGDANADGAFNISDGTFILNALFAGGPDPTCNAAADANSDGGINIADGVYVLNALFGGGDQPGAPFPDCGADPAGATDCEAFAPCP